MSECWRAMSIEQQEAVEFYSFVAGQARCVGDMPNALSIIEMTVAAFVSGYPPRRWRPLIEDAQLLFQKLVVGPEMRRRKREAKRAKLRAARGRRKPR